MLAENHCLIVYLHSKYPAHSNNAEDVEDGRSHDGADPDITLSDENACTNGKQISDYHTRQPSVPRSQTCCLVSFFGNLHVVTDPKLFVYLVTVSGTYIITIILITAEGRTAVYSS